MRRTITRETWEQIFTGYAAGVRLREIARRMNIPEGTVQAHSKRHGWTRQIQSATRHPATLQPNATDPLQAPQPASPVQPVQSVPQSVAAILSERKGRSKLALSKYAAEASEAAGKHPDKLSIAGKVKDVASVHKALWPEESGAPLIDGGILIGTMNVIDARTGYVCEGPDKGKYTDVETGAIITNPRARLNEHVLDAQTGEAGVKGDQEEKESRGATQSQSLPADDATDVSLVRPFDARESAGEASRRAYRERCTNWRRNAR